MAKKKDSLIEEAKKNKADLDELKKKKKILDVKPAKRRTWKTMNRDKMMKLETKNIYIHSTINEIIKNNFKINIDKNFTPSSDSEIIRYMILHAFRNSFGLENLKSGLQEYEKNSGSKQSSKIAIILNHRMFQMISVFKNNFEYKTRKTITTSQILNSLVYYASKNNFNHTLIPEYVHILESYSKTENALRKKRKTEDENTTNKTENDYKNEYLPKEENTGNYARLIEYVPEKPIENLKNEEIQRLEEKQKDLNEKMVQINSELNDLNTREGKIQDKINLEKSQLKEREEKGISKILNRFSNKNKPVDDYSKQFFQEKNQELTIINLETRDKLVEQRETDMEIKLVEKEILKIKESDVEIKKLEEKILQEYKINEENEGKNVEENPLKGNTCKGKCKEFKAKRPLNGKRYDSGQARCQICEQWIDYHGAHIKNNVPATEYSVGWYCNCCNYRVRQKPRNKIYKEKLIEDTAAKQQSFESLNQNPCPKCGIKITADNIESVFGMRMNDGKSIRQSQCRKCRNFHSSSNEKKEDRSKITLNDIERFVNTKNMSNPQPYTSVLTKFVKLANQFPNESMTDIFENRYKIGIKSENTVRNQRSIINHFEKYLKSKNSQHEQDITNKIIESDELLGDTDTINRLISDALFMIQKDPPGIYEEVLRNELNISENKFKQILPKLTRLENIVEELEDWDDGVPKKVLRSVKSIEKLSPSEILKDSSKDISENYNEKEESQKITYKMVAEHLHWKTNISKKLKIELINSYLKHKSMKKVYDEFSRYTKLKVRLHLVTNMRLPPKLKEIESSGGLHSDPKCSIVIALYATDYYNWDDGYSNENKIIDLAKSISKYLQKDINMNNTFEGKK